ncbi:hypothetical protein [Halobellus inordinatus]|uniref:hypothetical protein n=1 Tax=Halobellus inordinatus TaxID=1126236 RepID=UPI00210ED419|nr:hypothetical protein [Halobellus inordinatus]
MSRSIGGSGGADVATVVVECDPSDVGPTDHVRDLDQLTPAARREFLDAVSGSDRAVDAAGLATGDVVRFTEYYRII